MLILVADTCTFGGVTFGATDVYGAELYFLDIDGWGAPQSTVQAVQKAAGDGAFASPAFSQSRVFTMTGAIVTDTRAELVAAIDRAIAAASIQPQPVTVSNGGQVRYVIAQRQGEVTQKETSDVSVELTFQFLAVDPRKYGPQLSAFTGLPSSSGGLTIPFTIPFSIDSTVVTGQCSLTNPALPGDPDGPVLIRVEAIGGATSGPVVTHAESGLSVVLDPSFVLVPGNWLTIDMDNHTVLENDQADRASVVISRGWSGFQPGINTWSFTAAASAGNPMMTVTASPAWY